MEKLNEKNDIDQKKRAFVKKAAYTAPAIVTMAAIPSFASAGSGFQQQRPQRNPNRGRGGYRRNPNGSR